MVKREKGEAKNSRKKGGGIQEVRGVEREPKPLWFDLFKIFLEIFYGSINSGFFISENL